MGPGGGLVLLARIYIHIYIYISVRTHGWDSGLRAQVEDMYPYTCILFICKYIHIYICIYIYTCTYICIHSYV